MLRPTLLILAFSASVFARWGGPLPSDSSMSEFDDGDQGSRQPRQSIRMGDSNPRGDQVSSKSETLVEKPHSPVPDEETTKKILKQLDGEFSPPTEEIVTELTHEFAGDEPSAEELAELAKKWGGKDLENAAMELCKSLEIHKDQIGVPQGDAEQDEVLRHCETIKRGKRKLTSRLWSAAHKPFSSTARRARNMRPEADLTDDTDEPSQQRDYGTALGHDNAGAFGNQESRFGRHRGFAEERRQPVEAY